MLIPLTLIQVRDILSDWYNSTELDAARRFEARQIYAQQDAGLAKRIVPVELGKIIKNADQNSVFFYVQFKSLTAEWLDQWSKSPAYAVVWPTPQWRKSTEHKLTASETYLAAKAAYLAKLREEDRITRMARKITAKLPALRDFDILLKDQSTEQKLKDLIKVFENIIGEHVYEQPENPSGNQAVVEQAQETPRGEVENGSQAPQSGGDCGSETRQAGADEGETGCESEDPELQS